MATSSAEGVAPVRSVQGLGRAIRRARQASGLTQAELAERAFTNRQAIVAIEAGHETRALAALFHTLEALGLELAVQPRMGG